MKAQIVMDPASKAGILKVIPETPVEEYALHHWFRNFQQGSNDSIFVSSLLLDAAGVEVGP